MCRGRRRWPHLQRRLFLRDNLLLNRLLHHSRFFSRPRKLSPRLLPRNRISRCNSPPLSFLPLPRMRGPVASFSRILPSLRQRHPLLNLLPRPAGDAGQQPRCRPPNRKANLARLPQAPQRLLKYLSRTPDSSRRLHSNWTPSRPLRAHQHTLPLWPRHSLNSAWRQGRLRQPIPRSVRCSTTSSSRVEQ